MPGNPADEIFTRTAARHEKRRRVFDNTGQWLADESSIDHFS
jgi:hypothetical protein